MQYLILGGDLQKDAWVELCDGNDAMMENIIIMHQQKF